MIEEQPKTKVWYDDFPISSKLLNIDYPKGFWKLCLFIPIFCIGIIFTIVSDFVIFWAFLSIWRGIKWLAKKLLQEIIEKFIAKVLAISAFAIMVFLIFVIIKSGSWEKIYATCAELLQ